jgi:8-oxo-dGTP pyrophosphatase MutT (NUDIX family)
MPLKTIFAPEPFPDSFERSLFLAGPSPRKAGHPNWRAEALTLLEQRGYDGHVFLPIPRDRGFSWSYLEQVQWEQDALDRSDVVLFWIPRDLKTLPGFTTNVEFGQRYRGRKVVLGFPPDSPKNRYLAFLGDTVGIPQANTLSATIDLALQRIAQLHLRHGGECEIPAHLWTHPALQTWLQTQKQAGNRLDSFRPLMQYGNWGSGSTPCFWSAWVKVWVAAEERYKKGEIIIGRPDMVQVAGIFHRENPLDSEVVLVREFRSNGVTESGFVEELPGGAVEAEGTPVESAAREWEEETGLPVAIERLKPLPTRQIAGTSSVIRAHAFYFELSHDELEMARTKMQTGARHGLVDHGELCYLEIYAVRDLLRSPVTDWTNLGILLSASLAG